MNIPYVIDNPELSRQAIHSALKALRDPLPGPYLTDLGEAYEAYQRDGDLRVLLDAVEALGSGEEDGSVQMKPKSQPLKAADLHLACWEYVWS